jgi:hypothetical protein
MRQAIRGGKLLSKDAVIPSFSALGRNGPLLQGAEHPHQSGPAQATCAPHDHPKQEQRTISRIIFVNLPLADFAAPNRFYEGPSLNINAQFSDDTAAFVDLSSSDYLMLLTQEKFASFTTLPAG